MLLDKAMRPEKEIYSLFSLSFLTHPGTPPRVSRVWTYNEMRNKTKFSDWGFIEVSLRFHWGISLNNLIAVYFDATTMKESPFQSAELERKCILFMNATSGRNNSFTQSQLDDHSLNQILIIMARREFSKTFRRKLLKSFNKNLFVASSLIFKNPLRSFL